ncbi:MAG: V-type ATP synthase subunit F [Candidatus Omnitrophica bacterium]|jgi:V/A-type H+-transporting ATPase subunit F|nr:V-type ATP synthase subunit F [Candidatus Omnitrophota bacterium]
MTFFCIADKESSLGFKFSGIETREISTKSEALEAFNVALALENVGIIIITEKAASFIRDKVNQFLYREELPLILEVPSRGPVKKRKSVSESLKEMIGISV